MNSIWVILCAAALAATATAVPVYDSASLIQSVAITLDPAVFGEDFQFGCPRCRNCESFCDCMLTVDNIPVKLMASSPKPSPDFCPVCVPCQSLDTTECPKEIQQCRVEDIYDRLH